MPLLRRRKSYNMGDILVYYFLGFFEEGDGEENEDDTSGDIIPVCSLILGIYKGTMYLNDWDSDDGEISRMFVQTKEVASCDFVIGEAKGDLTMGTYQEYVDPEWILGAVCGTVDLKDPYAIQSYLSLLWKKHHTIFEQGMNDLTYQRLTEWEDLTSGEI